MALPQRHARSLAVSTINLESGGFPFLPAARELNGEECRVDPRRALAHARSLAPDIVLIDHSRDSEWAFYAGEEEKCLRSWAAVEKFLIRRREGHCGEQRFRNYSELATKIEAQGKTAIERSLRFVDRTNIVIPMRYELTLL